MNQSFDLVQRLRYMCGLVDTSSIQSLTPIFPVMASKFQRHHDPGHREMETGVMDDIVSFLHQVWQNFKFHPQQKWDAWMAELRETWDAKMAKISEMLT